MSRMARRSISRLLKTVASAFALGGLAVSIVVTIAPYFQQPEVVYSTEELSAYPVPYKNNNLVPGEVQGKMLEEGPIRILSLVVKVTGETGADVMVRIPFASDDKYIGGWMRKSEDPSTSYMLGRQTEYRFDKLAPGDTISFYLYLKDVNADIAGRIEVLDGDGHRATHYQYVPVRYVGSDRVIVSIERRWIYLFGFTLVLTLLLSIIKPK